MLAMFSSSRILLTFLEEYTRYIYIYIYYIVVVISHGKFLTLVHNILEIVVMLEDPRDEYLLVYGGVVMFSSLILHAQKRM